MQNAVPPSVFLVPMLLMLILGVTLVLTSPASATPFFFSTGSPDGLIATLSRPAGLGLLETETADDFLLTQETRITGATIIGLIPSGAPLSIIKNVEVEIYRVFPNDSDVSRTSGPPTFSTVNVPTRVNSPADVEIGSATRNSADGSLTFTSSLVNSSFSVLNTVVNGIHPIPNQFTGGDGPTTGEEVSIAVNFTTPIDLAADKYFLRPEIELTTGGFLWLSAPKPVDFPGTSIPDLQSWIRTDDGLAPDWLRIGTDITHQGPFNTAFSLSGETIPEPSTLLLLGTGLVGMAGRAWRRRRRK